MYLQNSYPGDEINTEIDQQITQPAFRSKKKMARGHISRISVLSLTMLLVIACSFPLFIIFGYYGYLQIFERIVPGVHVGSVDLTWMRISQAATEINADWNLLKKINVTEGFQVWQLYPHDLGLSVDGYQTAERAFEMGRFKTTAAEIGEILKCMLWDCQITPAINFNPDAARGELEKLNQIATKPPKNATFTIQDGKLVPVPGELGYEINLDASMNYLMANIDMIVVSGMFNLQLQPIVPQVNDASELMMEAQAIIEKGITIHAYDAILDQSLDMQVDQSVLANWIVPLPEGDGQGLTLDPNPIARYLNEQSKNLGEGRWIDSEKNASSIVDAFLKMQQPYIDISHGSTQYTVKKGDTLLRISWNLGFPMWKIIEANPGLDPERLYAGQVLTVPSKDDMLPLPVIPNKRIVIDIGSQRMMVYEDGKQIRKYLISTGIDRSPTQPGIFQVLTHKNNAYASVWDLTMPNFLGIYEAWPGFMNGIHGLPVLSNGTRLWGSILGKPASFGCIILDLPDSRELFQWAEDGVVVEIRE